MNTLFQDLRFGLRMLRKNPGVTVIALLTLALCIGANLTILAVIDAILVRPLPFPVSDRLVTIFNSYPKAGLDRGGASFANYYSRRGNIPAFSHMAAFKPDTAIIGEPGSVEPREIMRITPESFATLGVGPTLGRAFMEDEMTYDTDRVVTSTEKEGRPAIRFDERAGGGVGWWPDITFANGALELDVRGKDVYQKSFLGIAFHGQDEKTYDVVYFRPFNFRATDPARRNHAVQYVALPAYDWQKLRSEQPEKFEKAVTPVSDPNSWFHVRVMVAHPQISVFVNGAAEPCLAVEQLSNRKTGWVGFWVGHGSGGEFANLKITPVAQPPLSVKAGSPAQTHLPTGVELPARFTAPLKLPTGAKPLELVQVGGIGTVRPFLIGQYEVTQAQYTVVVGNNPSEHKSGHDYPVETVNWDEAKVFCQKLTSSLPESLKGKTAFRLPTDAEWSVAVGLPNENGGTPKEKDFGIKDTYP
ncbi:MAG TPA: SUMF1/EgtB/PvdO family nonheme iron enzyme [Candidatus Paceibacterota bacterium]|nr:SUMF1/EgtB/PvdO family nonheme iron enzyme [Verrucomicrobiota bacterium]HRY48130.1 SUMF1/EgtB/PvdO family nonheme iron enzyme [Candidatus Paceibacterota bacterium]